jgi:iron complex outermembrane receptor protein
VKRIPPVHRPIALSLLLAAAVAPAWGQNKRAASLEEVVVYARKMNENQQTVPISMVVNSGKQLETAQVVDFQDITKITPGLTITSEDPTSSSIKIRGVGLSFFGLAADPGVVITVDEFPQSRIGAVFGAFLDVRQVEVLKGPQGTLYGRNAPSGVISIWSNRPDYEGIHGRAELSASTYDTLLGEAAINLPVIDDKLAVRLAYIHNESDGYTDLAQYDRVSTGENTYNYIYSGQKIHADEIDGDSARATILFEPTESLSFTTRLNHTDYSNGLVSQVADGPMIYTAESAMVDPGGDVYVADRDDNLMFQDNLDYSDYTLKEGGLRTEWSTEAGRIVSLSQYQEFETELSETIDAKPSPFAQPRVLTSNDELYTQELRWHSQIGDSITYLVGAFYAHQDVEITYQQLEPATEKLITVHGTQDNDSYALYTNFEYQLDEQWSFSLGGRYNDETESIDSNLDLTALFDGDSVGGAVEKIGQVQDEIKDDNTSFSFKTRFQYDEDVLFYFAWDSAYKSGGYNPQVANISGVFPGNNNIATLESDFLKYPAEESTAYEIGMKSIWLDQSLLVNIAVFYQDFENFQNFQAAESERVGGFGLGVLINSADEVNTQGVELELSWLISEEWNASFTSSYANATVDQWDTNFCDEDDHTEDPLQLYCPLSDGSRLNDDPKWTSNAQLGYRAPLGASNLMLFSHLSYAYAAEGGGDDDRSLGTLDMNIGIEIDNWSVKVWSRNLFDEKDYTGRTTESDVAGVNNFVQGRNIRPRTIGVTAIYNFNDG